MCHAIFRRVRVTIGAVKKQLSIIYFEYVCSFSYSSCKAHVPCYTFICGLYGSTIFFHIIS
jgi:hypothetical protein